MFVKTPFRIIIHGKELISGIVPESAQPFNFKEEFNLSEEEVNSSLFINMSKNVSKCLKFLIFLHLGFANQWPLSCRGGSESKPSIPPAPWTVKW